VPKTFIRNFPGLVIYVREKNGENLKDFWIWELNSENRVKRAARAQSARIVYDEAHNKLVLTMHSAKVEMRDEKDPENYEVLRGGLISEEVPFDLSLDRLTGRKTVNVKSKWKILPELLEDWEKLGQPAPETTDEERWKQRIKLQTVIHEKAATAFSVLSFALIAIPLGIRVSRKETSANLGVALALAMAYYIATFAVGTFDNKPHFRPDLLMWLPNIAFQALGIWMFRQIDRN
jgi:lipopolysaccharide export system permease protein